jgi:hypothetical protein
MAIPAYPTANTGALITLANAGNVTVSSPDQTNAFSRGAIVVTNLTDVAAGNVTVKVQGKDEASGVYYDLLDSAALTGNGTTVMTVYPGATVTANVSADSPLPATWRVQAIVSSNGNVTGTVGASVVQ